MNWIDDMGASLYAHANDVRGLMRMVEDDLGGFRDERAPVRRPGLGSVAPVDGMKVLVTGAAGFLGRALVLRLVASGAVVIAVDDVSAGTSLEFPETRTGAVAPVLGDVRDAALLGEVFGRFRPEAVVHLAAVHFIPECERDPRRTLDVNVSGTQSVIDACAKRPPRALFFASTADVYAHSVSVSVEVEVEVEDATLDPIGVYGVSKLTGERLLRDQAGRLADCRVLVGRLFNLYGPGDPHPHLVPEVVRQVGGCATTRLRGPGHVQHRHWHRHAGYATSWPNCADWPGRVRSSRRCPSVAGPGTGPRRVPIPHACEERSRRGHAPA